MLFPKKSLFSHVFLILLMSVALPSFLRAMDSADRVNIMNGDFDATRIDPDWGFMAAGPSSDPLITAIRTGDVQAVEAYLGDSVCVNTPRYDDQAEQVMFPLEAALDFKGTLSACMLSKKSTRLDKIVRLLLERGANPNLCSVNRALPLDYALKELHAIKTDEIGAACFSYDPLIQKSYYCLKSMIKHLYQHKAVCREYDMFECLSLEEIDEVVGGCAETARADAQYLDQLYPDQEGKELPYRDKYRRTLKRYMQPTRFPPELESLVFSYHRYHEYRNPHAAAEQKEREEDDGGPAKKKCRCVIQ
jgi:hypothetical protein